MAVNLGQNLDRKYGIESPKKKQQKETPENLRFYIVVQEPVWTKIINWLVVFASGFLIGFSVRGLF